MHFEDRMKNFETWMCVAVFHPEAYYTKKKEHARKREHEEIVDKVAMII